MIRTALICALVVVDFDVVHAFFGQFIPLSAIGIPWALLAVALYVAIGFRLSRRGVDAGTAIRAVATAAFADVAVGLPLALMIVQDLPRVVLDRDFFRAIAIMVLVNTALGSGGIWLGSIGRGVST